MAFSGDTYSSGVRLQMTDLPRLRMNDICLSGNCERGEEWNMGWYCRFTRQPGEPGKPVLFQTVYFQILGYYPQVDQ